MVAPRSSTPTVRMTVSAISRRSRRDKATNCPRITDTARCPRSP
jgi:hypothetical protein